MYTENMRCVHIKKLDAKYALTQLL